MLRVMLRTGQASFYKTGRRIARDLILFGLLSNAANVIAHRTVLLIPMSAHRSSQETGGNQYGGYSYNKPHVPILSRCISYSEQPGPRARLRIAQRQRNGPAGACKTELIIHLIGQVQGPAEILGTQT